MITLQTAIVGSRYKDGADAIIQRMRPRTRLVLRREPNNPVDSGAVAVYTTSGVQLGYVPKVDNVRIAERLDDPDVDVRCFKTSKTFNSIVIEYHMEDPLA